MVVSVGDAILRESDVTLLSGPFWVNDRVIGFYFEYLYENKFESMSKLCFISPEVSQFLKLVSADEISVFFEPLKLEEKETILLAVNNASDPERPGGSHWSLLIFTIQAKEFFHLDSSLNMNDSHARQLAKKLHGYLIKKLPNKFSFRYTDVDVLQQSNGYDCGIHVMAHAEESTRHFLVYGNSLGLDEMTPEVVKGKRAEVMELVDKLAATQPKRKS